MLARGGVGTKGESDMTRKSSIFALAAALLASPGVGIAAPATTNTNVAAADDALGGDIIVTARKRGEERLQDIPASISALSGDTLAKMGVSKFEDFAYSVPGLTFTDQGPGLKRYTLRGVQSAGQEQVAVYYDEVPVPGIQSSSGDSGSQIGDLNLYDMERIEVLKGPQSTTFGSNSQTGAIRFITKKPDLNTIAGSAKVTGATVAHGDPNGSIYGMVNMPLVDNVLGIRVVGYYDRTGGYIDNTRLGQKNINSDDTYGGRGILRYEPSTSFSIDAEVWVQKRNTHGSSDYSPYDTFHISGDTTNPGYKDNVPTFAAFQTGEFKSGNYVETPRPDTQQIYSLTANGDLGFAQLTVTGSLYKRKLQFYRDNSFSVISLGVGPVGATCPGNKPCVRADLFPELTDQTQDLNQKAFEARLNSKGTGRFQWVAGVFARDRQSGFRSYSPIVDSDGKIITASTPPTGFSTAVGAGIEDCNPCAFARVNTRSIKEAAVFGEGTFDVTSWLEVMGGLRYYDAKQRDHGLTLFQFPTFGSTLPAPYDRKLDEHRLIKKGQVSVKPTEDISIYALASQGFRLGGTNQSAAVQIPDGYESDSLWNYELGFKSTWFNRRLIFNAALYQIDWKNIQVSGRDPTGSFAFIGNAGAAKIQGAEAEVQARVAEGFDISGGFNWLPKRELTEDQISADIAAPGKKGDKIPRIPAFTATASAQYSVALPVTGWTGLLRGDYSYKGKAGTELRPTSATYRIQHAYSIVNLRAAANNFDNGVGIALFADNIFDKAGDVYISAATATPTTKYTNRPRTIGVELTKSF